MNIGIVTTWFERGAAYVSKQIMDVLDKEHNVFIYARGGEIIEVSDKKWTQSNVYIGKELWLPTVTTPINKKDFHKWILENGIEAVIFNEQHWLEPIIWCNEWKVKTIAYVDYYKNSTIRSFELYDYLICNTLRHYSVFNWHKGAVYIPWGTNKEVFKKTTIVPNVIFHSIGMSPYRKGTDLLLKAFFNSNRKLKLVLHTQIDLLSYYREDRIVYNMILELLQEDSLEIIFKTVGAPGLYHLGEFYIYPSRLDGIGLTVAESIAMGLIPIVSDNGPMNEFVLNKEISVISIEKFFCREDGYYWPIGEIMIDSLTQKINLISELSNEEKEILREEYEIFFNNKLDWGKNSKGLIELFENVEKGAYVSLDKSIKAKWYKKSNSGLNQLNKYLIKYNSTLRIIKKIFK